MCAAGAAIANLHRLGDQQFFCLICVRKCPVHPYSHLTVQNARVSFSTTAKIRIKTSD